MKNLGSIIMLLILGAYYFSAVFTYDFESKDLEYLFGLIAVAAVYIGVTIMCKKDD